MISKEATLKL